MRSWIMLVCGIVCVISLSGCGKATTKVISATESAVSTPPATASLTPSELDLKEYVNRFVKQQEAAGYRTLDHLTVTQLSKSQSGTTVLVDYGTEFEDRLAYKQPEDVPSLKGKLAYMKAHGAGLDAATRVKAEQEINALRQELQGNIDHSTSGSTRIVVKAELSADGMVVPSSVQVLVSVPKELIPGDEFLARMPKAEAIEQQYYSDMEQRYGQKS